ncbi:hypothetical protein ACHAWF_017668 [Thalassiosira exigua]
MGKKSKKPRRFDDDDLLGPPSTEGRDGGEGGSGAGPDVPAATADAAAPETSSGKENTAKKSTVDIDLPRLEAAMTDVLRDYEGGYQSEEWLRRTLEKNLRLPKNALRRGLEPHVWDEMLARAERDVREMLDREESERLKDRERLDGLAAEMCEKTRLSEEDEARLREESRKVGLDPDKAVAAVAKAIGDKADEDAQKVENAEVALGGGGGQRQDGADASLSVSVLVALQPYLLLPQSNQSALKRVLLIVRKFLCLFVYNLLHLIFGQKAKARANAIWEKTHLPSVQAAQLSQEKEEDERMLRENTHLWSNQRECWIKKDSVYSPPSAGSDGGSAVAIPETIRWDDARKQWERWSKNLTTRTKATKRADGAGIAAPFTRGAFVAVRAGEGWASAPDHPEAEKDRIASERVRFFLASPARTGGVLEVADVTSWAAQTLLTKKAAREADAVDSGRALFSIDALASSQSEKGGKKGRGGIKKSTRRRQHEDENVEGEEGTTAARKGAGCTARISKKYLDRL